MNFKVTVKLEIISGDIFTIIPAKTEIYLYIIDFRFLQGGTGKSGITNRCHSERSEESILKTWILLRYAHQNGK